VTAAAEIDHSFIHPWETWKADAVDEVDAARTQRWREGGLLSAPAADEVALVCWRGMWRRGYGAIDPVHAARAAARIGIPTARRLRGLRAELRRRQAEVDAFHV